MDLALEGCLSLAAVYFVGDAPTVGEYSFSGSSSATVYYLPGKNGWGTTFGGRPAVLWNPRVDTSLPTFGRGPGGFGLPITGTPNIPIVLEAAPTTCGPEWVPLLDCTLTNGLVQFRDSQCSNYPARFYRIRSP